MAWLVVSLEGVEFPVHLQLLYIEFIHHKKKYKIICPMIVALQAILKLFSSASLKTRSVFYFSFNISVYFNIRSLINIGIYIFYKSLISRYNIQQVVSKKTCSSCFLVLVEMKKYCRHSIYCCPFKYLIPKSRLTIKIKPVNMRIF